MGRGGGKKEGRESEGVRNMRLPLTSQQERLTS